MRIVCWHTMKYHTLFFSKLGNMLQNLVSVAAVTGTLKVISHLSPDFFQISYVLLRSVISTPNSKWWYGLR